MQSSKQLTKKSKTNDSKSTNSNCATRHCRRPRKNGRYCYRCAKRRWREANPVHASYLNLKNRARQRHHEFDISLAEFDKLVTESGYIFLSGRQSSCLTINRINPNRGYVSGNLEVITGAENLRQQYYDQYRTPDFRTAGEREDEDESNEPF